MSQYARHRGVDELLIAVHPRHAKFYERFIGFEIIGGKRLYESVCCKPAVALALDLNRLSVNHPRAYKRFFGSPFSEDAFRRPPIETGMLAEMRRVVYFTYGDVSAPAKEAAKVCA
jgi:hypothetical protein